MKWEQTRRGWNSDMGGVLELYGERWTLYLERAEVTWIDDGITYEGAPPYGYDNHPSEQTARRGQEMAEKLKKAIEKTLNSREGT